MAMDCSVARHGRGPVVIVEGVADTARHCGLTRAIASPRPPAPKMTTGNGRSNRNNAAKAAIASACLKMRVERASGDADQGLQHNCQHRRLHAQEKRLEPLEIGRDRIKHAEGQDDDGTGYDKQQPRRQSAPPSEQAPAYPRGELLRLRPREEVTEIERVQIIVLADPATLFY